MINIVLLGIAAVWFLGVITDIRVILVLVALWHFGFLDQLIERLTAKQYVQIYAGANFSGGKRTLERNEKTVVNHQLPSEMVIQGYKVPPFSRATFKGSEGSFVVEAANKQVEQNIKPFKVSSVEIKPTMLEYGRLNCWKDNSSRTIPDASTYGYNNTNYKTIPDAVQKCGDFAKSNGFPCFAVQDGGACFTGPDACNTYKKLGAGVGCLGGKGGAWLNEVYQWQ